MAAGKEKYEDDAKSQSASPPAATAADAAATPAVPAPHADKPNAPAAAASSSSSSPAPAPAAAAASSSAEQLNLYSSVETVLDPQAHRRNAASNDLLRSNESMADDDAAMEEERPAAAVAAAASLSALSSQRPSPAAAAAAAAAVDSWQDSSHIILPLNPVPSVPYGMSSAAAAAAPLQQSPSSMLPTGGTAGPVVAVAVADPQLTAFEYSQFSLEGRELQSVSFYDVSPKIVIRMQMEMRRMAQSLARMQERLAGAEKDKKELNHFRMVFRNQPPKEVQVAKVNSEHAINTLLRTLDEAQEKFNDTASKVRQLLPKLQPAHFSLVPNRPSASVAGAAAAVGAANSVKPEGAVAAQASFAVPRQRNPPHAYAASHAPLSSPPPALAQSPPSNPPLAGSKRDSSQLLSSPQQQQQQLQSSPSSLTSSSETPPPPPPPQPQKRQQEQKEKGEEESAMKKQRMDAPAAPHTVR